MRRMTPDSTTDQLQNKTLWSSYNRNYRCETSAAEHGTGRRAGGFGCARQPAGEPYYHLRGRIPAGAVEL